MNFKKYGLGKSTDINFRQHFGININSKKPFLKKETKTMFNKININKLTGRKLFINVQNNIEFQQKIIKSYIGMRHRRNYPVRGQRTHTNATRKNFKKKNLF